MLDYWDEEVDTHAVTQESAAGSASAAGGGGFKKLKESLVVAASGSNETALSSRQLTASSVFTRDVHASLLVLHRLLRNAAADSAIEVNASDIAKRVILFAHGKLKRKGFYPDQEVGNRNFDDDGVLSYLARTENSVAGDPVVFTASDREFDTTRLTAKIPPGKVLYYPPGTSGSTRPPTACSISRSFIISLCMQDLFGLWVKERGYNLILGVGGGYLLPPSPFGWVDPPTSLR